MNDWVSIKDSLPETDGNYLCAFSDGSVETFTFWAAEGGFGGDEKWHVTHWHPMIPHPEANS